MPPSPHDSARTLVCLFGFPVPVLSLISLTCPILLPGDGCRARCGATDRASAPCQRPTRASSSSSSQQHSTACRTQHARSSPGRRCHPRGACRPPWLRFASPFPSSALPARTAYLDITAAHDTPILITYVADHNTQPHYTSRNAWCQVTAQALALPLLFHSRCPLRALMRWQSWHGQHCSWAARLRANNTCSLHCTVSWHMQTHPWMPLSPALPVRIAESMLLLLL